MFFYLIKNDVNRFLAFSKKFPLILVFYIICFAMIIVGVYSFIFNVNLSNRTLVGIIPYTTLLLILSSFYSTFFRKYPIIKLDSATYYFFSHTIFFNKAVFFHKIKKILFCFVVGFVTSFVISGCQFNRIFFQYLIVYTCYLIISNMLSWIIYQENKRNMIISYLIWILLSVLLFLVGNTFIFLFLICIAAISSFFYSERMEINHNKFFNTVQFMTLSTNAVVQFNEVNIKETIDMKRANNYFSIYKPKLNKNVLARNSTIFLLRTQVKSMVVMIILPIIIMVAEKILFALFQIPNEMFFRINGLISYVLIIFLTGIVKMPIDEIVKKQQDGLLYLFPKRKLISNTVIYPGGVIISLYSVLLTGCFWYGGRQNILLFSILIVYYFVYYVFSLFKEKTSIFINLLFNIIIMLLITLL